MTKELASWICWPDPGPGYIASLSAGFPLCTVVQICCTVLTSLPAVGSHIQQHCDHCATSKQLWVFFQRIPSILPKKISKKSKFSFCFSLSITLFTCILSFFMAGKFRDKLIICRYCVTVMFSKTVIICTSLRSSLYNLPRKEREERKEIIVSLLQPLVRT